MLPTDFLDNLTQLYSRSGLINRLRSFPNQANHLGIIYINLVGFRDINHIYGHDRADQLLALFARILKSITSKKSLLARLAGDEFVVALTEVDDLRLMNALVERIEKAFRQPLSCAGESIALQLRFGMSANAAAPYSEECSIESLLNQASLAAQFARNKDINEAVLFNREIERQISRHSRLRHDLQLAISKQQLYLLYQPIIKTNTGDICGAEALLRWQHPDYGLVPAEETIAIAESSGLIEQLSKWVLINCIDWLGNNQSNLPQAFRLGINLSATLVQSASYLAFCVEKIGAKPNLGRCLEFEITESKSFDNDTRVYEFMSSLHQLGVVFSLDDFGTGYASFERMQSLNFDAVKLDRSIVHMADQSTAGKQMIAAIVALLKPLGMTIVAEGIEGITQMETIRHLKCHEAQGYWLYKPMQAKEFQVLISRQAS